MSADELIDAVMDLPRSERNRVYKTLSDRLAWKRVSGPSANCERTADFYKKAIKDVAGIDVTADDSRRDAAVWARNIIAYQMLRDGFSAKQIGAALGRNRATILGVRKKVENMFATEKAYLVESRMYKDFTKYIAEHDSANT